MFRSIVVVLCLALAGPLAAKVKYEDNTMGGNRAISNKLVETKLGTVKASTLLATQYDGFYQITGRVTRDVYSFKKVKSRKSFPDDRWEQIARQVAEQVRITAFDTGSRIKPSATAYVVLYKDGIEGLHLKGVRRLATSESEETNGLAILMIKKSDASGNVSGNFWDQRGKGGSDLYFFEVAI